MAAAVLLAGCLVLGGCGQGGNKGGPPKGGTPEVAVVTMATQRLPLTSELAGRTSASLVAEVRPQVGGLIQKRLFTEGADVEAGQTLYQIDPATYQAALENARAALGRSEANLSAVRLRAQRLRDLLADKAVSQQDSDDAEAALKQNEADIRYWKAAVETARINLQYTTVTAPILWPWPSSSGSIPCTSMFPSPPPISCACDGAWRKADSGRTGRFATRFACSRRTAWSIPWKGPCSSRTSPWTPPRVRLCYGSSFPIPGDFSCRACTSGPS